MPIINSQIAVLGSSGGGSGSETMGEHEVRFIDYDGTVLKTQYVNTGEDATPPADPDRTSEGLSFQGWLSGDNFTNIQRDSDIGAIYTTVDGKTHIHISIGWYDVDTYRQFYVKFYKNDNSELTIDWGNGTTSTTTGSGNQSLQSPLYTDGMSYVIKLWISSGSGWYGLGFDTNAVGVIDPYSGTSTQNSYKGSFITRLHLGDDVKYVGSQAMYNTLKCRNVSLSNGLLFIGNLAFLVSGFTGLNIPNTVDKGGYNSYTYNVDNGNAMNYLGSNGNAKNIVLSKNAKFHMSSLYSFRNTMLTSFFQNDFSLEKIVFPATETNEPTPNSSNYIFSNCHNLRKIVNAKLPTYYSGYSFSNCYNLEDPHFPDNMLSIYTSAYSLSSTSSAGRIRIIDIPSTVTSISSNAFAYRTAEYFIVRATTPPTLANTNAFTNISGHNLRFYVPDASLNSYKTATNWSTYAFMIRPLSEIE